jgi:YafQ family addiction module toxin component
MQLCHAENIFFAPGTRTFSAPGTRTFSRKSTCPHSREWKDHPLKGEWASHRECHVGGDFLLIYRLDEEAGKSGAIVFTRAGTHSELFGA